MRRVYAPLPARWRVEVADVEQTPGDKLEQLRLGLRDGLGAVQVVQQGLAGVT